jgi:hypothetical protein
MEEEEMEEERKRKREVNDEVFENEIEKRHENRSGGVY